MPVLYANNAASRLAASITNVATSFSVTAGHGVRFPAISGGDHFYATLMDSAGNLEVVKVTARATDTFTVQRAQEGTTARAYAVNDIVELRITKAMLDDFKADTRTGNFVGQLYGASTGAPDAWIWSVSPANPTWGIFYNEGTPDAIEFKAAGSTTASIFLDTGAATFGSTVTAPTFSGALSGNASTATNVAYSGLTGTVPTWNQNTSGSAATVANTNLGNTVHSLTDFVDAASWSKPAGYQTMINVGLSNASGFPTGHGQSFFGYTITSRRDGLGGYSALLTSYDNSNLYFTYNTGSAGYPTWRRVLHDANFNSFAPTLTGTGASGSWAISVTGSSASTTGNAATATALQTARTINGTSFNGSANITTANWGTARDINGTSINGSANYAIGRIYDTNYRRITNPGGAEYVTTTASVTGAIAITLPVGMTNTMVRMTIKVYEYTTNESFEIHCGGYNAASGTTWANNPFAYIVGNPGVDRRFTVRFGYDSVALKAIVYIGELASTWSYPQVYVTDVQAGYSGNAVTWTTGWAIGFEVTAFKAVTATITNSQVGYAVSTNTANSTVLRDGSGNFSAGTITAALSGNATTATTLQTARTIGGVSFNGSANINLPGVNTAGNQNTTGSAATLTTARTINGTSFNGSANITTANWGTDRTITIGSTGKSVNGSANVAWTLAEIGALPLSGGAINTSGSTSSLIITDTGASGANLRLNGNGATTPNKTIRVQDGRLQVINSGYTNSCLDLFDDGALRTPGNYTINNSSPTIFLQDTDNNSAMLHCNSNLMYILRGANNSTTWTQVGGYWPVYWDLTNNNATFGGSIWAAGNITAYSDEKLKTNWSGLTDDFVAKLAKVKSGVFDRIDTGKRQVGVSAQSLQDVMPEAVDYHEKEDLLSVAYGNAALVSAIELAKRLLELEKEFAVLKEAVRGPG